MALASGGIDEALLPSRHWRLVVREPGRDDLGHAFEILVELGRLLISLKGDLRHHRNQLVVLLAVIEELQGPDDPMSTTSPRGRPDRAPARRGSPSPPSSFGSAVPGIAP